VAEDLSVVDGSASGSPVVQAARQVQAQQYAADIQMRAAQLAADDKHIAAKIVSTTAALNAVTFREAATLSAPSPQPAASAPSAGSSAAAGGDSSPVLASMMRPPVASPTSPDVGAVKTGGSPLAATGAGPGVGTAGAVPGAGAAVPGSGVTELSARAGATSAATTAIGAPGIVGAQAIRGVAAAATPMAQPLAYTKPNPSPPVPPGPQPGDAGQAQHAQPPRAHHQLTPPTRTAPEPASPSTTLPPPSAPSPAQSSAPAPAGIAPAAAGGTAPSVATPAPGTGRGTIQMLGGPFGLGPAPQAPYSPLPLAPGQPAPPPFPLPPHNTPIQPPTPPSWTQPPMEETGKKAQDQYKVLTENIKQHNSWRPDPSDANAVEWYNAEAKYYNEWKAQLEGQLWSWHKDYTPALTAVNADAPPWTGLAPPPPAHPHPNYQGPGSWVPANESMSVRSAEYQEYITGHPITETYKLPGYNVTFDGYQYGYLNEVKSYFEESFIEHGEWKWFFRDLGGLQGMINQARSQVVASRAYNIPLRWIFAEGETKALVERTFDLYPELKGMIEFMVIPP
jgi:hypothetical protein